MKTLIFTFLIFTNFIYSQYRIDLSEQDIIETIDYVNSELLNANDRLLYIHDVQVSGSGVANKYALQEINQLIYNIFLTTNSIKFVCELAGANTSNINYEMQILETNLETVYNNYEKVKQDYIAITQNSNSNVSYLDLINLFLPEGIFKTLFNIFLK
jgi:hypothetical protein